MRIVIRVGYVRYKRERGQWTMRAELTGFHGADAMPIYLCRGYTCFIRAAHSMREELEDWVRGIYGDLVQPRVVFVWRAR